MLFPPIAQSDNWQGYDIFPSDASRGRIGLIWGDWGVGKTTLALQASLNEASSAGNHVWYLTTHHYPVMQRVSSIVSAFPGANLGQIHFVQVKNFRELREQVEDLEYFAYLARNVGQLLSLVIIDSVTNLYTLSLGKKDSSVKRNQELNQMLGFLKFAAKKLNLSVLLTAEEKFRDVENIIEHKPAGGRIMDFWVDFSLKVSRGRIFGSRVLEVKKNTGGNRTTLEAKISTSGIKPAKVKREKKNPNPAGTEP
jgi:RecA/RadA recombinase